MADRFYTPDPLVIGDYVLEGPEAHHLTTVRRFSPGDQVTLFDGSGAEFLAEILGVDRKRVSLQIQQRLTPERELPFELTLAVALPKGDRAEVLVEKLTELGVQRFIPLITERSVVLAKDSKIEKFQRVVIEASKQCGRNSLMQIDAPRKWSDVLRDPELPGLKLLLHTEGGAPLRQTAADRWLQGVVLAVGPEGGFSAAEVEQAGDWQRVTMGPRIMRVETAAIAAAACLGNLSEA